MEECPICLSPLSGAVTTVGCCRKQFHAECILKCTQHKNECPMCRVKECIVYVPEVPVTEPEVDQRLILRGFLSVTAGAVVFVIGVIALKNYAPM